MSQTLVAGSLVIDLGGEINEFLSGMRRARGEVDKFGDSTEQNSGRGEKSFLSLGRIAEYAIGGIIGNAFNNATASFMGFIRSSISGADTLQQTRIAFETMLGSGEKAGVLLKQLSDFGRSTPFELPRLQEASKQLLAFGFGAGEIIPVLTSVGNIASGVGMDKLPNLIYALGQVRAQGKLMGQDLLQFTNAGVPLIEELAKVMKKPVSTIKDLVSEGKIGFNEVRLALDGMAGEGGRFFNLMQNQSKTYGGIMSNISDQIGVVGRKVVGISEEGIIKKGGIFDSLTQGAGQFLDFLNNNADQIGNFFGSVSEGIFKIIDVGKKGAFRAIIEGGKTAIYVFGEVKKMSELVLSGFSNGEIFNQGKDSKFIQFLSTAHENLVSFINIVKLLATGDFQGGIFGMGEDSKFISLLLSARENSLFFIQNILPQILNGLMNFSIWFSTQGGPAILGFVGNTWSSLQNAFIAFKDVILPFILDRLQTFSDFWSVTLAPAFAIFMGYIQPGINNLQSMFSLFSANVMPLLQGFAGFFMSYIYPTIGSALDLVMVLFGLFITVTAFTFGTVFNVVTTLVKYAVDTAIGFWNIFGSSISNIFGGIFVFIKGAMDFIVGIFTGNGDKVKEGFLGMFKGIAQTVGGVFEGIFSGLKAGLNTGIRAVNSTINKLPDEVAGIKVPKPQIPEFSGGVSNFEGGLAYVHQNELLANLPRGTTVHTAKETKDILGSKSDQNNTFYISGSDPKTIAQEVLNILTRQNENTRAGLDPAI